MLFVDIIMCTVVGILILDHCVRLVIQIDGSIILFYSMLYNDGIYVQADYTAPHSQLYTTHLQSTEPDQVILYIHKFR